jgi:Uma2 family endonuclease
VLRSASDDGLLPPPYTLADYLSVEEMSSVRHEYLNGEIFAMAGGTPEHAALSAAVVTLLGSKLRGGPCRPYSFDLRLRVKATGLATYPDAAVICGEVQRDPESPTHATNPSVLVEVLSPSTEEYDRGEKREHYQRLDSLREYVLVSQDRRRVEVLSRSDDGAWQERVHTAGGAVKIASLGFGFGVDELYEMAGLAVA